MLQCKFISSTFTEATFVSLSLRQFKFCVSGIVASSSLPEIARCWRGERNAVPLNKDEFCALGNRLKVDGSVLGLFSARRVSASVQPSWTHQTLSCRVPATSQLFCCCSPPLLFSWKPTCLATLHAPLPLQKCVFLSFSFSLVTFLLVGAQSKHACCPLEHLLTF